MLMHPVLTPKVHDREDLSEPGRHGAEGLVIEVRYKAGLHSKMDGTGLRLAGWSPDWGMAT